jgi:multicomponent Na+:H+ antiporter subunit E
MLLRWIKKLELFVLLMVFWLVLNGRINSRLIIFGAIFSILIIRMTYSILFVYDDHLKALPSLWHFLWFGGIVFVSIIKSSINHCIRIFKNENRYKSFEVEMASKNVMINTLIANAITLTPGTISIGLEDNRIQVVGFANNDADVQRHIDEIKNYEKPFYYKRS